jgi:hypothetical protein
MSFLLGVAKGAVDQGTALVDERRQRREKLVDYLTVKYMETAENAKSRRQTERQEVAKAAQFFKQNNLPPELLERAIVGAKSPTEIYNSALELGSQWQRARTNEQTRGMFSGPADQWNRDYSDSYSNLQGMTERFSSGGTGEGEVGATGGFGTPIAEAASNQAIKGAAAFSGMRPEELAGAVRNVPAGSQAGSGITEGLGLLSKEELDYVKGTQPSQEKLTTMLALGKEAAKRVAEDMNIDATIMPDGSINFGSANAMQQREFARRATEAQATIMEQGGFPDIAKTYRESIMGANSQPTAAPGGAQQPTDMRSAVQSYAEKFRKVKGRDPSPQELQQIERELRQRGVQ